MFKPKDKGNIFAVIIVDYLGNEHFHQYFFLQISNAAWILNPMMRKKQSIRGLLQGRNM